MNSFRNRTRAILKTLALGLSIAAVAVPLAQAGHADLGAGTVNPLIGNAIRAEQLRSDVDPLIGDAIRAEQLRSEVDPLIGDAIRAEQASPDFWNYDPTTGEKTSNTSPGLQPSELATLYSPSGNVPDSRALDFRATNPSAAPSPTPSSAADDNSFQWGDAGIGAGAALVLVVMGAVVGTVLTRRRHGVLVSR
jgi:hypothetical protein